MRWHGLVWGFGSLHCLTQQQPCDFSSTKFLTGAKLYGLMDASERLFGFVEVDIRVCRPQLAWTLLGGGSAQYFDGTNTRILDAGQWLQPAIHTIPMSGFLGLIQPLLRMVTPHYIQLRIYTGEKHGVDDQPLWEHLYKRSFIFSGELSPAIEQFLQGASPSAQVRLWRAQ
jgi:hypothetical protein